MGHKSIQEKLILNRLDHGRRCISCEKDPWFAVDKFKQPWRFFGKKNDVTYLTIVQLTSAPRPVNQGTSCIEAYFGLPE